MRRGESAVPAVARTRAPPLIRAAMRRDRSAAPSARPVDPHQLGRLHQPQGQVAQRAREGVLGHHRMAAIQSPGQREATFQWQRLASSAIGGGISTRSPPGSRPREAQVLRCIGRLLFQLHPDLGDRRSPLQPGESGPRLAARRRCIRRAAARPGPPRRRPAAARTPAPPIVPGAWSARAARCATHARCNPARPCLCSAAPRAAERHHVQHVGIAQVTPGTAGE